MSKISKYIGAINVLAPTGTGSLTEVEVRVLQIEDLENMSVQYVIDYTSFQDLQASGAFELKSSSSIF